MKSHKLVVVGAGHVGSYVLADAMKLGLFGEIAVIDVLPEVARGEALDQFQATGVPSLAHTDVHVGGVHDYADADIIVICAGTSILKDPENPDAQPDRTMLTAYSAGVVRQIMADIAGQSDQAVIILITNPLDTMVYLAENEFGYPAGRVFGTGTMLDSTRLRRLVAHRYGVAPASVSGYMMGEHGLTTVPALSRLTVGGVRWDELARYFPSVATLTHTDVQRQVVSAAYDVLNGKGWTNAGIAQAAVLLARNVLLDEAAVQPVCTTLRGEYGHDGDVALSMPSIIGRRGVIARLPVTLDDEESRLLAASIDYIRQAIAQVRP